MNPILTLITGALPEILKRLLPAEKMSELDRATLEQQLTLELAKQDWQQVQAQLADVASARELGKADIAQGNAFTSSLAAIVRPLWGIGAFALVIYSVATGHEIGQPLQQIIELVLFYYFGSRLAEKLTPTITGAYKK